jgi:hypothetical protein
MVLRRRAKKRSAADLGQHVGLEEALDEQHEAHGRHEQDQRGDRSRPSAAEA